MHSRALHRTVDERVCVRRRNVGGPARGRWVARRRIRDRLCDAVSRRTTPARWAPSVDLARAAVRRRGRPARRCRCAAPLARGRFATRRAHAATRSDLRRGRRPDRAGATNATSDARAAPANSATDGSRQPARGGHREDDVAGVRGRVLCGDAVDVGSTVGLGGHAAKCSSASRAARVAAVVRDAAVVGGHRSTWGAVAIRHVLCDCSWSERLGSRPSQCASR